MACKGLQVSSLTGRILRDYACLWCVNGNNVGEIFRYTYSKLDLPSKSRMLRMLVSNIKKACWINFFAGKVDQFSNNPLIYSRKPVVQGVSRRPDVSSSCPTGGRKFPDGLRETLNLQSGL